MSDQSTRPPVLIRFRFNIETGEMELIIDDASPDRSEEYHDKVAQAIAGYLGRNPVIRDAGPRFGQEGQLLSGSDGQKETKDEQGRQTE